MTAEFGSVIKASLVLINDLPLRDDQLMAEILPWLTKPYGVRLINADDCALALAELISNELGGQTLAVFPGQGAEPVRQKLADLDINPQLSVAVQAKRLWTPGTEKPCAEIVWPQVKLPKGIARALVCDDVVSTGATILAVKEQAPLLLKALPWEVGAWVLKIKNQHYFRSEFQAVKAAFGVKDIDGDLAINSLSTLLQRPTVLESFAQRRTNNPSGFCRLMQGLGAACQQLKMVS